MSDAAAPGPNVFWRGSFWDRAKMKRYMCVICGLVYEEEQGWPDDGIAPGTLWEDVPLTWKCPECGAGKEDFEMVEF